MAVKNTEPEPVNLALTESGRVRDSVYRRLLDSGVPEPDAREEAIAAGDLRLHQMLT